MPDRHVIILADYVLPHPVGGAGISAVSEAERLTNHGWSVTLATRVSSQGSYLSAESIGRMQEDLNLCCQIVHVDNAGSLNPWDPILLVNNISLARTAEDLRRRWSNATLVFRRHIDWTKKAAMSTKIGLTTTELFRAHRRHKSQRACFLYEEAIRAADLVLDVHPRRPARSGKFTFVPPISRLNAPPTCRAPIPGQFSVLIGGRLSDPLKGGGRVVDAIRQLAACESRFQVHLMGTASASSVRELRKVLGDRFVNHGWIHGADEQREVYLGCNAFLTLPYYEPYGLMTVEALVSGLAVVSSSTGIAGHLQTTPEFVSSVFIADETTVAADAARHLGQLISAPESHQSLGQNKFELPCPLSEVYDIEGALAKLEGDYEEEVPVLH